MPADEHKKKTQQDAAPLYYFYGENTRRIDEGLGRLQQQLFGSEPPELDCDRYDGQVHGPADVLQAVRTIPFSAPRRLVILKRVDAWKDDQLEKLKAYCQKPSSSACLVFVSEKHLKKLAGWLKKNGRVVACANPRWDKDVKAFAVQELARFRKKATGAALEMLCQELNGNTQIMAGEIEKLALYCADRQRIDVADVEEVLTSGHRTTVFNLVDSIGCSDVARSLTYLKQLLDDEVYPLVVLKMISRQFRLIVRVREALDQRMTPARIGQMLGMKSDYVVRNIIKQADGWPPACLGAVFNELFSADRQLKSSRKEKRLILENLLLRLADLSR